MMDSRRLLAVLLTIVLPSALLHASVRWDFSDTLDPAGAKLKLEQGKPAFAATDTGRGLAPGTRLDWGDAPALRLRPELEIHCRFRLDALSEGVQILATKEGEYILRVDWSKERGHISFFVQVEGKWEPRVRGPVAKPGVWYDLRVVWTGQDMQMEVNGEAYKAGRGGRVKSGDKPLQIGPIAGVIDYLEVRNPSIDRETALAALPASKPAAAPLKCGGKAGWTGWRGVNGATGEAQDGELLCTFPSSSAMVVSPALACDIAPLPFICLEANAPGPGWIGHLDILTDTGTGSISFSPSPNGTPTVIFGAMSEAWTGTLRRLALSFSGGEGTVVLRRLALADRPVGTPSFYVRSLAPGRAKLRPDRKEDLIAGIQNVGGEAETITARLTVPEGIRLLGPSERTIPYLGLDDFDMARWGFVAKRAGTYTVRVDVSSPGSKVHSRELDLVVEPLPNLPMTDYVPRPQPAKTDYINLMHYCALWKEGTHWGWKRIEPWPERRPAIGWYDEGTPEVADWHIKYALEHGINGFIYCWYRADYEPKIEHRLGHAIHEGLFNARYRGMFTFTIMWENGCAKGVKDEADLLDNLLPFWIENYFTHPSYLKIDNQPVLFVWQPRKLIPELGGPAKTKIALERMREQCRRAGFKGLRIIACMDGRDAALGRQIAESGWDAVSGYNLSTDAKPVGIDPAGLAYRDHADVLGRYRQTWLDRDASTGDTPDIPNVVMGRDDRAWGRIKRGKGSYIKDPKAENFEAVCRQAKELVDAKPRDRWDSNMVVFDNWTEFGEGHYIEPTTGTGFTFVNAIKNVFCTKWAPEAVTDIIPEDLGMFPPEKRYQEVRAGFGDHLPWQPVRITGDLLAKWDFETVEDGYSVDSSQNGCRLKIEGDVPLVPGRGGKVLQCGSGGAVASVPAAFFHPGGVTVSLWCMPTEANQSDHWMLNTVGRGTEGYRLGLGGGHPVWQVPRESWSHGLRGPDPLPVNQWTHVAATFDNKVSRLYVNGKEAGTLERRGFINPGTSITIGGHSADMDRARFRGCLDNVRVYRRVLTAAEIAGLAAQ